MAFRRHALAVIRILRQHRLHLDLENTVMESLNLQKNYLTRTPRETAPEILEFLQTRLQHLLLGEGYEHETVAAVLAASSRDMVEAADKAQALEEIRRSLDFPALAVAFKRVINISRGAEPGKVNELLRVPRREGPGRSYRPHGKRGGDGPGLPELPGGLPGPGRSQGPRG